MAEDRFEPREINFRQWLPWTLLFRGFWVALDHKKLLLGALGIVTMACGWALLALVFFSSRSTPPKWPSADYSSEKYASKEDMSPEEREKRAWRDFKKDRNSWNLLYETAGSATVPPQMYDAADLAESPQEFEKINGPLSAAIEAAQKPGLKPDAAHFVEIDGKSYPLKMKPYGKLSTWPWFEDRGPNPFLLATGHAGHRDAEGLVHAVPWERGQFFDWFAGVEVPVLIEPLIKILRPVYYILQPRARFLDQLYFFFVIVWTVGTWAIFGGAITRIAAVEVSRNEKIGMGEALRFTLSRWRSYLFASFAPLIGLAAIVIFLMVFALPNWIPGIGELWNGVLWWLALAAGLAMAVLCVGLVGWPMIQATLSTEGSDSFDALSRSYSYVLQKPWSYLWYAVVALAYGAIVVFFVGFMGSLMVYLAKWGVTQSPFIQNSSRDPSFMFAFAPTSFGWQQLLLQDSPVVGSNPIVTPERVSGYISSADFHWWNYIGAILVAFWLYLTFLLVLGFGYSYFWSASTMIYLLMRRKVDDTELDEVYLEEEDSEEPYSTPVAPPVATLQPASASAAPVQMVEAPTLRTPMPTAAMAPTSEPAATVEGTTTKPADGNVGAAGEASS
jgi:hypothetical protein